MSGKVRAAVLAALLTFCFYSAVQADHLISRSDVEIIINQMRQAYDSVRDYTAVFHKKCALSDEECPDETAVVKFMKPFALYMKWPGPVNEDQEMIYVQGRNDDRIIGHPGSFPDITLTLDPTCDLVMRCNRRRVTQSGLGKMISITRALVTKHPDAVLRNEGKREIYGQACRCFSLLRHTRGTKPDDCWTKAQLCASADDHLPRQATFYNERGKIIEQYSYSNIKTNVGLTAADFDPENTEYNF